MFEQFSAAAEGLTAMLGDFVVVDDDDERLTLNKAGTFHGEVVPDDGTGEWRTLGSPDDLVEFYDPTDVFGDLADALAEAFPGIAPAAEDGEDGDDDEADEAAEPVDPVDTEDHEDKDPDDAPGAGSGNRG